MELLNIKCESFNDGDFIPVKYTGRGEDISPCFTLNNISEKGLSIAITLDDASHPIFPNYNHWLIWNIPIQTHIPERIPHGEFVTTLGNAVQGNAYGRHRYRGPKPPLNALHEYIFTFFILDITLNLASTCKRKKFLKTINGHIVQKSTISAKFRNPKK